MPQNPLPARLNGPWVSLLTLVLVVGILYTGKDVLLPLALGIVLAFVLTPLVRMFDRLRLPRFAGVALTMLIALGAVGGMSYVVFDQFAELSTEISQYTSSMRRKVGQLPLGERRPAQAFHPHDGPGGPNNFQTIRSTQGGTGAGGYRKRGSPNGSVA